MPTTDPAQDDSTVALSAQEQDIVQGLNRYLRLVDDINPDLLADRPCVDLIIAAPVRD